MTAGDKTGQFRVLSFFKSLVSLTKVKYTVTVQILWLIPIIQYKNIRIIQISEFNIISANMQETQALSLM